MISLVFRWWQWTLWQQQPHFHSTHWALLQLFYRSDVPLNNTSTYHTGARIAQWLERRTRDRKVAGWNPSRSGGRIFFSRIHFLCWLLFRYTFHPRVTAVARKGSRSFCQKCRWQVPANYACTLRMWLCMKWHGAWLYGVQITCAEMAADSCDTSHASVVSTPLRWTFKNALYLLLF